jgi:tight adherence protein B
MTRLALLVGLVVLVVTVAVAVRQGLTARRLRRAVEIQLDGLIPVGGSGGKRGRRPPALIAVVLARAELPWRPEAFWVGATALVTGVSALALAGHLRAAALLLLAGAIAPPLWVRRRARRNLAAFAAALPSFLDGMRQLLAVGASLQQALTRTVEGSGPEVRRYFAPVVRRIQNGASVPESLAWLAQRLDMGELHMLAAAVQTNARFGGPISPVLTNLTGLLRDRMRVERELKAATAEVRMTGWVLAGLPPLAAAAIALINPPYMAFLVGTDLGRTLLTVAVGLQLAGVAFMRRIMATSF